MNYKNIYDSLINKAQQRHLDAYTEQHHIVPRCMGGLDDPINLVRLTPEEHYVAHQLLIKIYPSETKLVLAARYMTNGNTKNGGRQNNRMYGWLKRRFSETMRNLNLGKKQSSETKKKRSDKMKGVTRKPLSIESIEKRTATRRLRNSGSTRKPRSPATKKKLSDANKGKVPKNKGANHTDDAKKKIKDALAMLPPNVCPHCNKSGKSSVMFRWHFNNCKLFTHIG